LGVTFKEKQFNQLDAFRLQLLNKITDADHVNDIGRPVIVVEQMYEIVRRQVFLAVVKSF